MASTVTDMVGSDQDTGSLSLEIGVLAVSSSVGNDASVFSGGDNAREDRRRGETGAERVGNSFGEYPFSTEKRMNTVSTGTSPPPQIASTQVIFAQSQRRVCKKTFRRHTTTYNPTCTSSIKFVVVMEKM